MAWQPHSQRHDTLPRNWAAVRRQVLTRDKHRCTLNGPHCTSTATHVDHIGPPDNHTPTNLRAACQPCHMRRTQTQSITARPNRKRPTETHPGIRPGRYPEATELRDRNV